jgi:hypothetical protein
VKAGLVDERTLSRKMLAVAHALSAYFARVPECLSERRSVDWLGQNNTGWITRLAIVRRTGQENDGGTQVILLTGLAELSGAVGLMIPRLRLAAGIGLALYALCVWPANFNHALNDIAIGGTRLSWWYHGPRLALQPVTIWWALWASGVTDWPFGENANR